MTGVESGPGPRRPLRLVQVGMGGWGRDWMGVTAASPHVEAVAWVDPSADARAATVARGAPPDAVFASLEEALRAVPADAVLVTTFVEAHVPVARRAFDAGLPVLLEKPFAPTLAEAADAVGAASAAGRTLMISQNYRFHPAPRAAAALIADGVIGDLVAIEIDFRRPLFRDAPVLERHRSLVHPLLVDMSIHHFDLLRMITGREHLSIEVRPIHPPSSVYRDPPAAYASLELEGDLPVSYRGSWISSGRRTGWAGEWRIEGTRGAIELASRGDPGVRDVVRLRTAAGWRAVELPDLPAVDRAGTVAVFAHALAAGEEPETSGRRTLPTLAVTLAAVRSATERRRVPVAELASELPEELR